MKFFSFLFVLFLIASVSFGMNLDLKDLQDDISLHNVLVMLGATPQPHEYNGSEKIIAQGKDLVEKGQTVLDNGKLSRPISKYFVCVNCHNTEREDPNLRFSDPDARLTYTAEKGLPFLQGSSFWGIVNRESWYNDDYFLKYGEDVKKANNNLREAIQLCAVECAQGRHLKGWEEDAILAYYWSLEMKLSDLDVDKKLWEDIKVALASDKKDNLLVEQLKSLYFKASPATFGKPLQDKEKGYAVEGDQSVGEKIFENSCRHCHAKNGVSDFLIDYSKHTFRFLKKNMFKDNDFSIYKIIRKGTYASPGARPYMPHYPLEKMSDIQIEGLRKYILAQAN